MESLRQMKMDLIKFHEECEGKSPEFKAEYLKQMQVRFYPFKHLRPLKKRREEFELGHRHRKFFKRPCFVCGGKMDVRHHIISLKSGGPNSKRNLVPLCHKHHREVHPWMAALSAAERMDAEFRKVVR